MRISKRHLAANVASKEKGHWKALDNIAFTKHGVVSTDGRRLMIVPYDDQATMAPPGEEALVSLRDAKLVSSMMATADDGAYVQIRDYNVSFAAEEDVRATSVYVANQGVGRFPSTDDFRKVLTKQTGSDYIATFDIDLLTSALVALKKASGKNPKGTSVTMRVGSESATFSTVNGVGVLLMRMTNSDQPDAFDVFTRPTEPSKPKARKGKSNGKAM